MKRKFLGFAALVIAVTAMVGLGQDSTYAAAPVELVSNGSFESGDFTDWSATVSGGPFRPWAVSGAGSGGGFGMDGTSPQDGDFVAWNGFDGGGPLDFTLEQSVSVPSEHLATIEWTDRIQWNFNLGRMASEARIYDVLIIDPDTNAILEVLYTFSTGTQSDAVTGDTGWLTHSADLSAYSGSTVVLRFVEYIPQARTGPAQFEIDGVSILASLATKAAILEHSGVPGKGISDAPGLQKLFNPNSKAAANAHRGHVTVLK